MISEMIFQSVMAILQAATEFLPISSSGHLALFSYFYSNSNLSFFVFLHLSSLLAVLVFTRKEIFRLLKFKKQDRRYILYLIIGIIPAGIAGLFLKNIIESNLNSLLFIGFSFIFSGSIILMSVESKSKYKINFKNSFVIGLAQILAIFPGVSRSGTTISIAKIMEVKGEDAFKFSFLMLIPLTLGATLLEWNSISNFSTITIIPFLICFVASLFFLNLLKKIVVGNKFWLFSIYCFVIGTITLILHYLKI